MTAAESGPEPTQDPSPDVVELMRAAHLRALDVEGIPMVLALVDAARPVPASTDQAVLRDGAAIAAAATALREELYPDARDDDVGVTYAVLAAVAYTTVDAAGRARSAGEPGPSGAPAAATVEPAPLGYGQL